MATSRTNIRNKFKDNMTPPEGDFGEIFDSFVHKDEEKATLQMVEEGIDNEHYVTPALLRLGLQNVGGITSNPNLPYKQNEDNFSGSIIPLEKFPIESSVQVYKNGQLLLEGEDYSIDYTTAAVTFLSPVVDRNIQIDYWYKNTEPIPGTGSEIFVDLTNNQTVNGNKTFTEAVTASSFVKSGGTDAQILAADGSVITAGTGVTISEGTISSTGGTTDTNAVHLTGNETITGIKTFSAVTKINVIDMNKIGNTLSGISWYTQGNNQFTTYLSTGTQSGQGPAGMTTPTQGTYVTTNAIRNSVDAGFGCGFIWEYNTGTVPAIPVILAELDNSGRFKVNGLINATSFVKSGGTSSQYLMADGSVSTAPAPAYKSYVALVSQSGTDDPTAIVLENTTGLTLTWGRDTVGNYTLNAPSALFTADKTTVLVTKNIDGSFGVKFNGNRSDSQKCYFTTNNSSGNVDSQLINATVEIRIYN